MDIKILTSITQCSDERRNCFVVGTHDGIFHSDEVVAVAILCLLHRNEKIRIVRSRNEKKLKGCNICVDVGEGSFDHHQKGFKRCRKDGAPYASAGLVWKEFGEELISKFIYLMFSELLDNRIKSKDISPKAWERIDKEVISFVDAEDNGIDVKEYCFSYISSFLPLWFDSNYDLRFKNALEVTINILKQKIMNAIGSCIAEVILTKRWNQRGSLVQLIKGECDFSNNILHIPSQTIPWVETITEINKSIFIPLVKEQLINFVIFPYPAGGWAAQCVPPSLEKKFEQITPFPKEWAGHTEDLSEISGIKGATFCHNGCFFARAKSKESIIEMCKSAMKKQ